MLPMKRVLPVTFVLFGVTLAASAAEIAPHRALYTLSPGATRTATGISGLTGGMSIEWSRSCDGWILNQRMLFRVYAEGTNATQSDVNFTSWEAFDGLSYRFAMRSTRNGEIDEDLRGSANLEARGGGGLAVFARPADTEIELPKGTIFPTEHSLILIERARAGDRSIAKIVFDGASVDGPQMVTAILGAVTAASDEDSRKSPLLARPSWRARLAFFPTEGSDSEPLYETGIRVLDNGVSDDLQFDYSEFSIKARLDRIEAITSPQC